MNDKKRFQRIMILMGVMFLIGVYYLYTQVQRAGDRWPYENEPGTLTSQVRQLRTEIARHRSDIAKIPAAKQQLAEIMVEYELAARVLPRETTPDQLLASIRTKAQQAGITPDRVVPTVVAGKAERGATANFEEWRFSLNIRGDYDQIATFINKMEEFESGDAKSTGAERRFFQVLSIDITSENNGLARLGQPSAADVKTGHQCNLQMATYRYTGKQ